MGTLERLLEGRKEVFGSSQGERDLGPHIFWVFSYSSKEGYSGKDSSLPTNSVPCLSSGEDFRVDQNTSLETVTLSTLLFFGKDSERHLCTSFGFQTQLKRHTLHTT